MRRLASVKPMGTFMRGLKRCEVLHEGHKVLHEALQRSFAQVTVKRLARFKAFVMNSK